MYGYALLRPTSRYTRGRCWEAVNPSLSVTVKATGYLPAPAYVCVAVTPLPAGVPSPQSQENETIVPSGSEEANASTLTVNSTVERSNRAAGGNIDTDDGGG